MFLLRHLRLLTLCEVCREAIFGFTYLGFGFACGDIAGSMGSESSDRRGVEVRVDCESGNEEKDMVGSP